MRKTLFSTAAALGLMMAGAALAQTAPVSPPSAGSQAVTGARPGNEIGTGNSLPTSSNASNISSGDTRADIAPRLPTPGISDNSGPRAFLAVAQQALQGNRTGEAQEALERAETRLLDRSTAPENVGVADQGTMVRQITDARMALAKGDKAQALEKINEAMAGGAAASSSVGTIGASGGAMGMGGSTAGAVTGGAVTGGSVAPAASGGAALAAGATKSMGNDSSSSSSSDSTSK